MTREDFMNAALQEAEKAFWEDEVPVGAIIVKDGKIFARAHNIRNRTKNALAHAETEVIKKACKKTGDWRLDGCDMYVTLEPCLMCAGACFNARLGTVYFGAPCTNKEGFFSFSKDTENTLNHNLTFVGNICEEKCSEILSRYFAEKRRV